MRSEFFNPASWDRTIIEKKIEKLGARVVPLGNGFSEQLERIFTNSLLGVGGGLVVDHSVLSPWEQKLFQLPRDKYRVLVILDFDGVFVSPLNAAFSRRQRTAAIRPFMRIIRGSDATFLLTSRIDPDLVREKFPFLRGLVSKFERRGIDCFPFFNQSAVTKLERWGKDKLAVEIGKSFRIKRRRMQMEEIITNLISSDSMTPFVIYIIGSSVFDRRAVLRLCQTYPDLAPMIVYFDTGHLLL